MITITKSRSDFFYPVLAAVAMITPILLVIAAGSCRKPGAGEFVVSGLGLVLAMLADRPGSARCICSGFSKAFKIAASAPNYSVTA